MQGLSKQYPHTDSNRQLYTIIHTCTHRTEAHYRTCAYIPADTYQNTDWDWDAIQYLLIFLLLLLLQPISVQSFVAHMLIK